MNQDSKFKMFGGTDSIMGIIERCIVCKESIKPKNECKCMKVEYLENGNVILKQSEFLAMKRALEKISEFDGESIWGDDRDDAAQLMMDIAEDALKGKYNYE